MPRQSTRHLHAVVLDQHQPSPSLSNRETPALPPSHPAIRHLRTSWKWAFVSHFLHLYEPMLLLQDAFSLSEIEDDLAAGTTNVLPRLFVRLLTCLTHDRKIGPHNAPTILYRQYLRRSPESLPSLMTTVPPPRAKRELSSLAPSHEGDAEVDEEQKDDTKQEEIEEPEDVVDEYVEKIDWPSLELDRKLDILHDLCEWHFQNPTRLRLSMKDDDEFAAWRLEPVGYDASLNSYWLLGDSRLWIQRAPPKKPRKPTQKPRGRPKNTKKPIPKTPSTPGPSRSRSQRGTPANGSNPLKRPALDDGPRYSKRAKSGPSAKAGATGRPSRAAADNANRRLAALPQSTMRPTRGTRTSSRLRSADEEDLWQEIPEEWLRGPDSSSPRRQSSEEAESDNGARPRAISDAELSELTELSELSDEEEDADKKSEGDEEEQEEERGKDEEEEAQHQDQEEEALEPKSEAEPPNADFVEWETLCVTLEDWQAFPTRFEQSTNYREKAFYKFLTRADGPVDLITKAMKEIRNKKKVEEAVVFRKRSSRIAIKESEKEEQKMIAKAKAEEEEKLERARRLEARLKKEEDDRRKREEKREARRREREAEEKQEEEAGKPGAATDNAADNSVQLHHTNGSTRPIRNPIRKANGAISNPNRPSGVEDWELDCEICRTKGMNLNDGHEIACCDTCGKWQHVWCHDNADQRAGRPRRDWNKVEFRCFRCQRPAAYQSTNAIPAQPTNGVLRRKSSIQPQAPTPAPANHQYHHTWQAYTPSPATSSTPAGPDPSHYGVQSTFNVASRPLRFDQYPNGYYQPSGHTSTSHAPYQAVQSPVPLTHTPPVYSSYQQGTIPQTNGQTPYRPVVQNGTHTPSHPPTGYPVYQTEYSSAQSHVQHSAPLASAPNVNGSYAPAATAWPAQPAVPQQAWNNGYATNGHSYSQLPYPSGGGMHVPSPQPHHYPAQTAGPQPIYSKIPPTS
ncbi:hypothetical protein SISNIDRAFT_122053 [Sistotremastrum niveocremeum HHB9708]|uniref:Zinc finger PHD-type domain-containing protein n=2 Tax=Sistotremastraceae TaxID=3402574 RepID=A0A164TRV4_9AGAM|nr:hypothetical protein SISNIDRAFT_122053 [Sistotremastrum niveocremeum HHB9708]KZT42252.1 hypothetical protein SISSUDRAFT_1058846 [Sistotremastrum suecicum HHB10207 ss-3]